MYAGAIIVVFAFIILASRLVIFKGHQSNVRKGKKKEGHQ